MVTVGVINASAEIVELLTDLLERWGYRGVSAHVDDFKQGKLDLRTFLRTHRPHVLIWDIAPPYDSNWAFLQRVREVEEARNIELVLTTTNKRVLDEIVGRTDSIELIGKPYDLGRIRDAVVSAVNRLHGERAQV